MGDEQPPALDEVEPGEAGGYWSEDTTITVSRYTKASLDEHRDGRPWDEYLEKLRREHADPLTLTDAEQIAERVSGELPDAETVTLEWDDDADLPVPDESSIASAVVDDLVMQLPPRIAGELEGRR